MSTIRSDRDRAIQPILGPCAIADSLSPAGGSGLGEADVLRIERPNGFAPAGPRGVGRVIIAEPLRRAAPARASGGREART